MHQELSFIIFIFFVIKGKVLFKTDKNWNLSEVEVDLIWFLEIIIQLY